MRELWKLFRGGKFRRAIFKNATAASVARHVLDVCVMVMGVRKHVQWGRGLNVVEVVCGGRFLLGNGTRDAA